MTPIGASTKSDKGIRKRLSVRVWLGLGLGLGLTKNDSRSLKKR